MSHDNSKTGLSDSHRVQKPPNLDLNDVEMVFGTPNSPKLDVTPAVHTITDETRNGKDDTTNNKNNDAELLEPDRGKPKPPLAGPEIDDLGDEKPADLPPYPGIDDGLLETGDKKPHDDDEGLDNTEGKDSHSSDHHDDHPGPDDGKWLLRNGGGDETDFAYDGMNGFGPRFGIDDRPGSPMVPGSIPDVNTYQQKKNLAQGMMDLALLSANANQLRYVVESASTHPYYYPSLVFIALSILLQIAVGVGLILNSRYNVKDDKDICKADKINNMTVLGIFLITIVNVFITSFSVASPTTIIQQAG